MNKSVDMKVVATIGHIRARNGGWHVRCACCGNGLGTPPGVSKRDATASLTDVLGWGKFGGLWYCPKDLAMHHKEETRLNGGGAL